MRTLRSDHPDLLNLSTRASRSVSSRRSNKLRGGAFWAHSQHWVLKTSSEPVGFIDKWPVYKVIKWVASSRFSARLSWLNCGYILTALGCFPISDEARYITAGASIIYIGNYSGLWYTKGPFWWQKKRIKKKEGRMIFWRSHIIFPLPQVVQLAGAVSLRNDWRSIQLRTVVPHRSFHVTWSWLSYGPLNFAF